MKKLLILPLLAFLSGCVTYYYPETALEDGVYYAEDDPSYTVYADGYVGAGYYPWYSLDYFYLGYYPYPGYRVGYGYPGGFYLGIGYGFSPWHYPSHHYGYYSPWYVSHHQHYNYPYWRPYRGYYARHYGDRHHNRKYRDRGGHDRYAQRDRDWKRDRDREDYLQQRRGHEENTYRGSSTVRRYVSTTPGGRNRGVVVRNRESTKIGKSKLQVGQQTSVNEPRAGSVDDRGGQPAHQARRSGGEVRYYANTKSSRSRTEPVTAKAPARAAPKTSKKVVRSRPPKATGSSGNAPRVEYSPGARKSDKKSSSRRKNNR